MNIGGVDIGRDGQREGWTEGGIERGRYGHPSLCPSFPLHVWKERWTEGRMERGRDGQRDVWIEGGMDRGWLDRGGMGIEWVGQWEGWTEGWIEGGMDRAKN
jgi:hypothetical protein